MGLIVPSKHLRLLENIGQGIFFHTINLTISCFPICIKVSLIVYSGEFGSVHRAHLIKWHGEGQPRIVAVKSLKGMDIYE